MTIFFGSGVLPPRKHSFAPDHLLNVWLDGKMKITKAQDLAIGMLVVGWGRVQVVKDQVVGEA